MLWCCNFIIDILIYVYVINKENWNNLKKIYFLEINVLLIKYYKIKKNLCFFRIKENII